MLRRKTTGPTAERQININRRNREKERQTYIHTPRETMNNKKQE